jgi:pimeloyl-ACP methyl ester carboxylesterase
MKTELDTVFSAPQNKQSYDAFLIIPGSGKVDYKGNAKGIEANIYEQLSTLLNNLGFATLRYDKRGVGKSEGSFLEVGLQELLNDIHILTEELKAKPNVRRVFLLGHSEGCILSTIYVMNHDVDGMIQLGGAGISLKTALIGQNLVILDEIKTMKGVKGFLLKKLVTKEKLMKNQNKIFKKIENSTKPVIRIQVIKMNAKWMREHFQYNDQMILETLKTTKIKTLCITGDKDVQADARDLLSVKGLKNPMVITKVIPNMDHILRYYDGNKSILNIKKQYKKEVNLPLHNELVEVIKEYCNTI